MKFSIRIFLLIYLLLAIAITTTLTSIGSYFLDKKDIQEHMDTLLAMSALSYQTFLNETLEKRSFNTLQHALENIPRNIAQYYKNPHRYEQPSDYLLDKFIIQVWTKDGQLHLHSLQEGIPSLQSSPVGFSNIMIKQYQWRVFSTITSYKGVRIIVAERYDTRDELNRRIARDDLYILLLTFPLSGLLIWIVIGQGLKSLDRIAREVSHRAPSHLEPVNPRAMPEEIRPVINELNHLFFRLQEGFEREKRFAADAAHELRTPLAAIKTQAQVALNTSDIKEKNIALQKLLISVNRSTHIVQQLLTLSKLLSETGNSLSYEKVDLLITTREILAMLAPSALEKNIDLTFDYDEKLPLIPGYSTAISILIRNLVDNAIRYSKEGGIVSVRVYKENETLVLTVSDNGPGIPEELQSRVFERFFRVLGNKSTGSGLGLAIVQQIATLHHAEVILTTPPAGTGLIIRVLFKICL